MNIAHSDLLSLNVRDNEKVQHPHALYHRIERYSFLKIKSAALNDPEVPEK
jgi:hypothetical protein